MTERTKKVQNFIKELKKTIKNQFTRKNKVFTA